MGKSINHQERPQTLVDAELGERLSHCCKITKQTQEQAGNQAVREMLTRPEQDSTMKARLESCQNVAGRVCEPLTKEERREATRIRIEARKERIAKLLLNIKRTQQPRFLVSDMIRERLFDGSSPSPLAAPPGGE